MQKKYLFIVLAIFSFIFPSCKNEINSPESDSAIETNIPWEKISGKLAYVNMVRDGWLINFIDGTKKEVKTIKKLETNTIVGLSFHPAGNLLTFPTPLKEQSYKLMMCNLDVLTGNLTMLHSADDTNRVCPSWSNDGRLAYHIAQGSNKQLHYLAIDGKIFFKKAYCGMGRVAWSPDNSNIVLSIRDSLTYYSLYKLKLSDKSYTLLKEVQKNSAPLSNPVYSPNGSFIAYEGGQVSSTGEVWIMNADGTNAKFLTTGNSPCWSPDGKYIAYLNQYNSPNIFIINVDTKEITQVTKNGGWYPTWIQ